ncbi:MAG: hypothetical protein AAF798_02760 [Bacteroidota bacterium]
MKTVHFLAVLLVLLLASCNKDIDFKDTESANDHHWSVTPRSKKPTDALTSSNAYFNDLFYRHINYNLDADPMQYVPSLVRKEFKKGFTEGNKVSDNMDFGTYIQMERSQGNLSDTEFDVYQDIYQRIENIPNTGLNTFENGLSDAYTEGVSLGKKEQLSAYNIYELMRLATLWYNAQGDRVQPRNGDCSIIDFLQDLISSASNGSSLANKIIKELGLDDPDGFFGEAGEIIAEILTYAAPAIAVIIEIVEWVTGDNCDDVCIAVSNLSVVYDATQSCALTRIVRAYAVSPAAEGYLWTVTQGNNGFTEATVNASIELTQLDPAVPMRVEVQPLCTRDDGQVPDTYTEFVDLSASGPQGDVGQFQVVPNVASQQHNHGDESIYQFGAGSQNTGNITYDVNVPSNLGQIIESGNDYVKIKWGGYGTGVLTFTAANACSTEQATQSYNIQVSF